MIEADIKKAFAETLGAYDETTRRQIMESVERDDCIEWRYFRKGVEIEAAELVQKVYELERELAAAVESPLPSPAQVGGADVSVQWSAWARGRLQGQVDNHPEDGRSAVEVIDDAIGVDEDEDELDGLRVTRR